MRITGNFTFPERKSYLILLLLSLVFVSCEDDDEEPAVIVSVEKNADESVQVSWVSSYIEVDYVEVYRFTEVESWAELIGRTDTIYAGSFTDDLVPIWETVSYYVIAYDRNGNSIRSNIATLEGRPIYRINVSQAEVHPGRDLLYLKSGDTIIVLDYLAKKEVARLEHGKPFGYFHVGNNGYGEELYIPGLDGHLYIYDLNTLSFKTSIEVGVPVESVISDGRGYLYMSVSPDIWWEKPLRIYERSSLQYLSGGGQHSDTRLRLLPGGKEIIEISRNTAPVMMYYNRFKEDGFTFEYTSESEHRYIAKSAHIFKVAPAHNYLLTHRWGSVFSADASLEHLGDLPRGEDEFNDFEFNSSGTKIYAGLNTRKRICVYEHESLKKVGEIKTSGHPLFMFRKENKLIVLSSPGYVGNDGPGYIGIETFEIE